MTEPDARPETFVARDRARRFAFRLGQIERERAATYAGERIGMTSFAEAAPLLRAIEEDVAATVEAVLASRLRDRERGETEIPLVVALEGVLERVRRARSLDEARRDLRVGREWAEEQVLSTLRDAVRRLEAFAEVYDAERILPAAAPADVGHVLLRVEQSAALDRLPAVPTERPGFRGPAIATTLPPLVTATDALEDLLRAARAEVPAPTARWRATRATPTAPLALEIGEAPSAAPAEATLAGPGPAAARTERAAQVLSLAHPTRVARTTDAAGETTGVRLEIRDAAAAEVGERLAPGVALPAAAEAAVRAYLLAAAKSPDATDPARLVAVLGVFRAVEKELEAAFGPSLESSAARVVALAVPREASRKAPVHREVVARLLGTVPGFPEHRVSDVVDGLAQGRPPPTALRPPDVAVVLAVLGRAWPGGRPFGDRVLPIGGWSDDDVMAAVREAIDLAALRTALDRGRDPGEGWPARFEAAAFGLLGRLARRSP